MKEILPQDEIGALVGRHQLLLQWCMRLVEPNHEKQIKVVMLPGCTCNKEVNQYPKTQQLKKRATFSQ
jgi:hypothetical protein